MGQQQQRQTETTATTTTATTTTTTTTANAGASAKNAKSVRNKNKLLHTQCALFRKIKRNYQSMLTFSVPLFAILSVYIILCLFFIIVPPVRINRRTNRAK